MRGSRLLSPWKVQPGLISTIKLATALAFVFAATAEAPRAADAVGCGSVIASDTTLTADLTGCREGLVVSGPVVLDLAGHTIRGVDEGTGVEATDGATVTGGTISGFAVGVRVVTGTAADLTIADNQVGVEASDFPSGPFSIRDNRIANNGLGVFLRGGSGDVTGNRVTFNASGGISSVAEPVTFAQNRVERNGGRGISVQDATSRLVGNTVRANAGDGIFVSDSSGSFFPYWFADNVADGNGGFGIAFSGVATQADPPATVDGGGNVARHNGDPQECLNIDCAPNRGLARKAAGNSSSALAAVLGRRAR